MTYEKNGLYIDDAHLEAYAENFARGLHPAGKSRGKTAAAELRRALRELRAAHDAFSRKWASSAAMPGAVRWLLDNAYLAEREGSLAAAELEKAGSLRFAEGGFVILRLCETLLRSGLSEVTEERIALFLRGFQRELILERCELRLFPAGMRCALVHALLRLYRGIEASSAPDDAAAEDEANHIFTALRWLSTADLGETLEEADYVEQTLRADPAGVYPRMAEASRAAYRKQLSELARRRNLPEYKAAQRVLALAQDGADALRSHVGWWLLSAPLGEAPRERRGGLYISANVLLTLFFSLLFGFVCRSAAVALLLVVPVGELVKSLMDFALLHTAKPAHVPRLALKDGVPAEGRTLCAVSALLTDEKSGAALARRLEESRLLSRDAGDGQNLLFAILADLPDSGEEAYPNQNSILSAAAEAVEALNRKYGGGFFLLTRPRVKTPDGTWSGWERKRGALLETMRLLRGRKSGVTVAAGDRTALKNNAVKYLLALDSDTRLTPGAARELIGAMLHPLNAPAVDETAGRVREGYGILAPRIGVELSAAGKIDFSRVFAGQGGSDPYGGACSDLNMDVWGRGGFAGKGIIDVDAYLACMGDRVPENRMLSHDAVEGAFLRAGFVGDVEMIDGWPGNVLSYYSRLERWTRGDWQNLVYLFRPGRALPDMERWKLFDSLRRSMVPVLTLAALLFGFFRPNLGLTAAAALLALACELLLTMAEATLRREGEQTPRFHSALFVGVGGGLVRTFLRLLLLPAEAWVCLSAACRALWRMAVSKKRLLEWRTAAQSERGGSGILRYYRTLWFPPLTGLALLLLAPSIIGKAAGVLWLLTPLTAALLSLPARAPVRLTAEERRYLSDCARDTFVYFDEFLTPEDHYLPPDNYQVQPPVGLARRTSPTNIGLGLLSVLAALDLGLAERVRCLALIEGCLSTVAALPKWNGHLYNWYDTETLAPLSPRYVSTVDSGNLCACLIALGAGLREYGRDDLAEKAKALADGMDFAPLFDPKRKLFYIGVDAEDESPTKSWYDLMSSEARLTGYLTVARGDVPREHWRRLSRAQVASGLYRGMASWTGTMFEYLMPELLLPLQPDSLLYESARFCLYVQQKRARHEGGDGIKALPWGVSESAYGALDPAMNYRYKAHGCAGLALKRGMDDEFVVSPYSSFLALAVRPHDAVRNLRRLEDYGMRGKYGFWEALDFTSSRLYRKDPAVVRCVMAHHQGMSLVSAANLLLDGVMQRRFLSDPAMGAYLGLIQEKVPLGGAVLRRNGRTEQPPAVKPPRQRPDGWTDEGTGTDFLRPRCCLLASPTYQLLFSETGLTRALWGGVSPYVPPRSPLDAEKGVDLFLVLDGETVSLLPDAAAASETAPAYSWRFSTETAAVAAAGNGFRAEVLTSLSAAEIGERREVRLTRAGGEGAEAVLTLRFRPLLAGYNDYVNHPAFYGLGLSAKVRNGSLLLRRLPRGGERELWMCLAPSLPCAFNLAPGRAEGRAARQEPAGPEELFLTDPLVSAACALELRPNEPKTVSFALAMAYREDDALESAVRILGEAEPADLPRSAAAVIGMEPADIGAACAMLPELCFPTAPEAPVRREDLWRFGISGDLPIVCAEFAADGDLDWARKLMDFHLYLTGCGQDFDLVFLSRDGAGYQKPLQSALTGALWRAGGEVLRDSRGGVHILEDTPEAAAVRSAAALRLGSGDLPSPERDRRTLYRRLLPVPHRTPLQGRVRCDWGGHGEFQFYVNRSLPPRAWQNLLTNGRFGCLATDCGTGNLWYLNAREHQLTPWLCQPNAVDGPERLLLRDSGGTLHSLFAAPEGTDCRVTYLPGAALWETRLPDGTLLRTTAFVPVDTDARVLLISCDNAPSGAEMHWQLDLQLAGSRDAARFCRTAQGGGFLAAENPQAIAGAAKTPFLAMATGQITAYTFDRAAALALDYNEQPPRGEPVFAAKLPFRGPAMVLVCGCGAPDALLALTDPAAAQAALDRTLGHWRSILSRFSLRSPEPALDRLMNGWVGYQALACRLLGRCSIYQSGGAYGFRDQLQDAVNLLLLDPSLAREQILRCCARQYAEGDVQHWWHEGGDVPRGVRTRCSDDLLWLPWALCEYVEKTGDAGVCTETVPYLSSLPLAENERDRYEAAAPGGRPETVLQHCRRAVELVMARGTGPHGLLPIGSGDWNDGFSAVDGESVWLSWFFLLTADRFAALLERCGIDAAALRAFCDALAKAADAAWDGGWYLRGWYGGGAPLGSHQNAECRIDSIAQSFAVLSGRSDPDKAGTALTAAVDALFDREHDLVKLFDPPFAGKEHPGYIESYGPGFRENGGQYTHGAMWLVMALLRAGRADEAWELLRALLPANKDPAVYKAEPFVLAADVYAAPGHAGEAGWSWYTGAAGWMFRIVTEELLGLRLRGGKLFIEPNLPAALDGCAAVCRGVRIEVRGGLVSVNGRPWNGRGIPLSGNAEAAG